jgi:hypothetical protein
MATATAIAWSNLIVEPFIWKKQVAKKKKEKSNKSKN